MSFVKKGVGFFIFFSSDVNKIMQDENEIEVPETGILKFTASWCGPCRKIAPFIHELSEEYDIEVTTIDIDKHNDLSDQFSVSSIPVTIFISDSKEIDRVIGANEYAIRKNFGNLKDLIEKKSKKNQIFLPNCKEAEVKNGRDNE